MCRAMDLRVPTINGDDEKFNIYLGFGGKSNDNKTGNGD